MSGIDIPQMPWEHVPVIGGPPGPPGPASEVPGPEGPPGEKGEKGEASTVPGPTGPAGGTFGGVTSNKVGGSPVIKNVDAVLGTFEIPQAGSYLLTGLMTFTPKENKPEAEVECSPIITLAIEGAGGFAINTLKPTKVSGMLFGQTVLVGAVGKKATLKVRVENVGESEKLQVFGGAGRTELNIIRVG